VPCPSPTPSSVWQPQRHPWNPGGLNFGPQYGYQQRTLPSDFWVWTFAYDVSGVAGLTLKYRIDADGVNPLATHQNETYAGGPEVGAWISVPMTRRTFPAGNVYGDPNISFDPMPAYIADQYHARVTGLTNVLVDYYIEAADARVNIRKSPIEHVWVGAGGGTTGPAVTVSPDPPRAGQSVTITYDPAGRPLAGASPVYLHYGFNDWSPVVSPDPAMTAANSRWTITVPVSPSASQIDMVFTNGSGVWDNNAGQDWHFPVQGAQPAWQIDGTLDSGAIIVAQNAGATLWAGLRGSTLYVATQNAGAARDYFILLAQESGAMRQAMWAKAGQVAAWDAFLAAEADNSDVGWFDTAGAVAAARGSVLEGTIDLRGELGVLPEFVRLAALRYATPDGGSLVASLQAPPSTNADGNADPAEFVRVRLCDLLPAGCPAPCDPDLNQDGNVDQDDVAYLINVVGGGANPTGIDPDFNQDGNVDQDDIAALINVVAGAGCP
jgi:hypothetical protein